MNTVHENMSKLKSMSVMLFEQAHQSEWVTLLTLQKQFDAEIRTFVNALEPSEKSDETVRFLQARLDDIQKIEEITLTERDTLNNKIKALRSGGKAKRSYEMIESL